MNPHAELDPYVPDAAADTPTGGTRKRRGVALAMAGLLAVTGVGVAGFSLASAAGSGSDTPEAALERLTTAASKEDLAGVIDALAPEERAVFADPARTMTAELQRIGALGAGMDLAAVPGVDVEVSGVQTTREDVNEDIAVLEITGGTLKASGDLDKAALSDKVRERVTKALGEQPRSGSTEKNLAEGDARVATVRRDGQWYVSVFYSAAEAARREARLPAPDPATAIAANGADSPEAAVKTLVERAVAADVSGAIAVIDPTEGRVLHEYGPLLEQAKADHAAGKGAGKDAGEGKDGSHAASKVTVEQLEFRAESDGQRSKVTPTRFKVSVDAFGSPTTVAYDGSCIELSGLPSFGGFGKLGGRADTPTTAEAKPSTSGPIRVCGTKGESTADAGIMGALLAPVRKVVDSIGTMSVDTVQVDGRWYVSPMSTATDLAISGLQGLDGGSIDQLLEGAGPLQDLLDRSGTSGD